SPLVPGLRCLRSWRKARWFAILVTPHVAGAVALGLRDGRPIVVAGIPSMGLILALMLFTTLVTGVESDGYTDHRREKEPLRYWFAVVVQFLMYLVILGTEIVLAWFGSGHGR
ncbi:MAG: hypothetical protein ACYTFI_11055, partial [Planctomycetota bacterium]